MARRISTCSSALAAMALVLGAERTALAQACCVAPGAAGVTRLAAEEDALAGLDARAQTSVGTLDASGRYRSNRTRDLALEQRLFGTVRVLSRGQIATTVPIVETVKGAESTSAAGGGLGDLQLSTRWDLLYSSASRPGFALLAGASAPTGRPPERAEDPLGAGATGTGTTQGWGGFAIEHIRGPWLYGGSMLVMMRAPRDIGPIHSSLAPRFTTALMGAHAWTSGLAVSLGASWDVEDRARANGAVVSGSARRALRVTSALQVRLGDEARLVASIYAIPPVPAVTAGEASSVGVSVAVVRPW